METEQITALKKQIGRLTRQHVIDLIPASAITSIRGPVISLNQRREDCSIATTVAPSRRPSRRPASFDPAPGRPSRALNAFMAFRSIALSSNDFILEQH